MTDRNGKEPYGPNGPHPEFYDPPEINLVDENKRLDQQTKSCDDQATKPGGLGAVREVVGI